MSWTLEQAANDLERYVLRGEPPSVDAAAMMVAWARCGIVGRQTCTVVSVMFRGDYDEYEVELSCGDSVRWPGSAEDLAFCPSCGRMVVGNGED